MQTIAVLDQVHRHLDAYEAKGNLPESVNQELKTLTHLSIYEPTPDDPMRGLHSLVNSFHDHRILDRYRDVFESNPTTEKQILNRAFHFTAEQTLIAGLDHYLTHSALPDEDVLFGGAGAYSVAWDAIQNKLQSLSLCLIPHDSHYIVLADELLGEAFLAFKQDRFEARDIFGLSKILRQVGMGFHSQPAKKDNRIQEILDDSFDGATSYDEFWKMAQASVRSHNAKLTSKNVFSDSLKLDMSHVEHFFLQTDFRPIEYVMPTTSELDEMYDQMDGVESLRLEVAPVLQRRKMRINLAKTRSSVRLSAFFEKKSFWRQAKH